MYEDSKEAMFCARATFLVAMGLFNYIETLGAFVAGYFQRDKNGKIKRNRKGKKVRTRVNKRFNTYLRFLGGEYTALLKKHPEVYDILRCGLTHEYLPKRPFSIVGVGRLTDDQMRNVKNIDRSTVKCGIVLLSWQNKKIWQIIVPRLLIDFQDSISNLIKKVEEGKDKQFSEKFFEAASQINLKSFSQSPLPPPRPIASSKSFYTYEPGKSRRERNFHLEKTYTSNMLFSPVKVKACFLKVFVECERARNTLLPHYHKTHTVNKT